MNTLTAHAFAKLLGILAGLTARFPVTIQRAAQDVRARHIALVTLLEAKGLITEEETKRVEDSVRACLAIEDAVGEPIKDIQRAVDELQQKIEGMIQDAVKEIEKSERREAG